MKKLAARIYLLASVLILSVLQFFWIELFQTGNRRGSPLEVQLFLPVLFFISIVLHLRSK